MKYTQVCLTPLVKLQLRQTAHIRNVEKPRWQSRKRSKDYTDLEVDFMGVKGEYVASQVLGIPFDSQGYGAKGDHGVDLYGGLRAAIKTNHRANGYLIVDDIDISSLAKVDILISVLGSCVVTKPPLCPCMVEQHPEYMARPEFWEVSGWMTVTDFRREKEQSDWGGGLRHWVNQGKVNHDVQTLIRLMREQHATVTDMDM